MRYRSERINHILTSKEAQKILTYISPIYSNSYVGLWLLQAIGKELDELMEWSNAMRSEVFPQNCTEKTLDYWKQEYGVSGDKNALLAQIRTRAPINPYKIEQIVKALANNINVRIEENTGPYEFYIYLSTLPSEQIDEALIKEAVDRAKPSHLIYQLLYEKGTKNTVYAGGCFQYSKIFTMRQVN